MPYFVHGRDSHFLRQNKMTTATQTSIEKAINYQIIFIGSNDPVIDRQSKLSYYLSLSLIEEFND
jgi:hypothetical protein